MKRRELTLALLSLALLPGCGGKKPAVPPPPQPLPLHLSPLTDLVPAAGLDWLLVARTGELLRASALGKPMASLLPAPSLDRLSEHVGFDARLADVIVAAGFGPSTLFLLQVAHDGALVEQRFVERLTSAQERGSDGPGVRSLGGMLGSTHRALADLDQAVLAFEVGPPGPLRAAVAFAQEKLHRARPALRAEPLVTLVQRLGDAPLLVFAPSPARSPWQQGAHGLLARALAVGVAATPAPEGLRARALLLGTWDDPPSEALRRLEKTLADIVASPLGHLTGLRDPLVPYSFGGDRDAIHVEAVLDAEKLAEGLRAATSAGLSELFPTPAPPQPSPGAGAPAPSPARPPPP